MCGCVETYLLKCILPIGLKSGQEGCHVTAADLSFVRQYVWVNPSRLMISSDHMKGNRNLLVKSFKLIFQFFFSVKPAPVQTCLKCIAGSNSEYAHIYENDNDDEWQGSNSYESVYVLKWHLRSCISKKVLSWWTLFMLEMKESTRS